MKVVIEVSIRFVILEIIHVLYRPGHYVQLHIKENLINYSHYYEE